MFRKVFIYLIRAGVGFYFIYPALSRLFAAHAKSPVLSKTIYACFATYTPHVSAQFVWITWNAFFIILGLMIAFWKRPLSWIIVGGILLLLKLFTAPALTYKVLLEITPVLLVTLALLVYYAKRHDA
jgi:hypothetical protein